MEIKNEYSVTRQLCRTWLWEGQIRRKVAVSENEVVEMPGFQRLLAKPDDFFLFLSPETVGFYLSIA